MQLYCRDPVAIDRAPGARAARLQARGAGAGARKRVTFSLTPEQFAFWSPRGQWLIEAGRIDFWIGASSADLRANGSFEITKTHAGIGAGRGVADACHGFRHQLTKGIAMRKLSGAAVLLRVFEHVARTPARPAGAPTKIDEATIDRWDPAMDAIVPKDWKIEKLAEGFGWAEGPIWVKSGGYLLFTDVPGNKMWKWSEKGGLEKFLDPSGAANPDHERLARSRRQRARRSSTRTASCWPTPAIAASRSSISRRRRRRRSP